MENFPDAAGRSCYSSTLSTGPPPSRFPSEPPFSPDSPRPPPEIRRRFTSARAKTPTFLPTFSTHEHSPDVRLPAKHNGNCSNKIALCGELMSSVCHDVRLRMRPTLALVENLHVSAEKHERRFCLLLYQFFIWVQYRGERVRKVYYMISNSC